MYKNIVIPVDLTDTKMSFKDVFQPALNFANAFGGTLHLVHIIPDFGMKMIEDYLPKHWMKDQKEKYDDQFKKIKSLYIPEGVAVKTHVNRGAIYDKVISYAEKNEADLIIISAVRPQFRDYMLGPNASKIVRHSSVSVLVVRD